MFGDVLDRKQAFLDYKNVDFTWSSHWIFPEGLIHDFGQKFEFFCCCFSLGKIGLAIVFGDVLDRNQAFPAYKNIDLYGRQIGFF